MKLDLCYKSRESSVVVQELNNDDDNINTVSVIRVRDLIGTGWWFRNISSRIMPFKNYAFH